MRVVRLELRDFRCYEAAVLEPHPGTTLLVGGNAQGKTSLLEAIGWLSCAGSFRGAPDGALVRAGTNRAVLRAELRVGEAEHLVEAEIAETGRNRVKVDRQPLARVRDLAEVLRVAVFAPDDLALVKGSPTERRAYLDGLVSSLSRRHDLTAREYERVLRQRNASLRFGARTAGEVTALGVWDEQLARLGAAVLRTRIRLIERLQPALGEAYEMLARRPGELSTTYEAPWARQDVTPLAVVELESVLAEALGRGRRTDLERGFTSAGPHRDDWAIDLAGRDARRHASQGEQRCLALALRLAAHRVVLEITGHRPVLLLDDVFSELDESRAEALVGSLPDGQVVLAAAGQVPEELQPDLLVRVEGGRIAEAAGR